MLVGEEVTHRRNRSHRDCTRPPPDRGGSPIHFIAAEMVLGLDLQRCMGDAVPVGQHFAPDRAPSGCRRRPPPRRCAVTTSMSEVNVHTWRSCTSTTPSIRARSCCSAATSSRAGAACTSTRIASRPRRQARGRMKSPIAAPSTGSTHDHPVTPHTIAPTITATEPSASDNTSTYAPSRLRLSFAPGRSSRNAVTFTASPITPTTRTGVDRNVRRITESSCCLVEHVSGDPEQEHRVDQRRQDLEPVEPERPLRALPCMRRRLDRCERHAETDRIGGHVPGVGEQRQRTGRQPDDDLHHEEGDGQPERDHQRPHVPSPTRRAAAPWS